jgi:DNA-binding transcriptional MerR regulator
METVYDSKQTAERIGIKARTLQKWAAAGKIRFETLKRGAVQKRIYNGEDVERLRIENQTAMVVPKESKQISIALASQPETAMGLAKPQLDTMNVLLSVLDQTKKANEAVQNTNVALLNQLQAQSKIAAETLRETVNSVLAQIFEAQKSERDDSMRRLELERRRKSPAGVAPEPETQPVPPQKSNGKAKGARA